MKKKAITAKSAERILRKLGIDYGNDGRTFYATNVEETEIWEFDNKRERDEFVNRQADKLPTVMQPMPVPSPGNAEDSNQRKER